LKLLFESVPHSERAEGDSGKEKLPFNMKKPLIAPDSGRVAIWLSSLGVERVGKKGQKYHNQL